MERGIAAVATLAAEAKSAGATKVSAVATSAVRDASNGRVFLRVLKAATGLELRILTGTRGGGPHRAGASRRTRRSSACATSTPTTSAAAASSASSFKAGEVSFAASMPLGCVRLTEMFVASPVGAPQHPRRPARSAAT